MLIPRDILEIHRVASKDETRESLQCVHAERTDVPRLTATDGHRLLTVTWTEPTTDDAPLDFGDLTQVRGFTADIPAETCEELHRVVPRGAVGEHYRHAWLEETNPVGIVKAGAGERALGQAVQCETKRPEMEFPNWRPVIEGVAGAVKIGLNGNLLADLLRTIAKVSGEVGVVLHIPADPTAPIGLHVDSRDGKVHVDAVLMPMRLELTGRPDWDDVPDLPNTPPKTPKPPKVKAPTADLPGLGDDPPADPLTDLTRSEQEQDDE